jgi:hypothetical protein
MESTEVEPGDRRNELLERAYRRGYALRLRRRRRLTGVSALVVALGVTAAVVGYANRATIPAVSVAATTTTRQSTASTTTTVVAGGDSKVSVSLIVPAGGIPSGKQVHVTLVIRNDTGAPIRSTACVPPGESVLGEMELSKNPPPPPVPSPTVGTGKGITNGGGRSAGACEGPAHDMVAVGTTRVPFLIEGSTTLCQFAPASQLGIDACLRGGEPLAPGTYYVSFIWYGGNLPTPPIAVQVVP